MKRYCVKIANFHFIVLSADYGDKTCALLFLELKRTESASQNPESSHSTTISFSFLFVFFVLQSQGNIWRISCICAPFYTHTADSLTNPPSLFLALWLPSCFRCRWRSDCPEGRVHRPNQTVALAIGNRTFYFISPTHVSQEEIHWSIKKKSIKVSGIALAQDYFHWDYGLTLVSVLFVNWADRSHWEIIKSELRNFHFHLVFWVKPYFVILAESTSLNYSHQLRQHFFSIRWACRIKLIDVVVSFSFNSPPDLLKLLYSTKDNRANPTPIKVSRSLFINFSQSWAGPNKSNFKSKK